MEVPIVATNREGLGSRLKCLLSVMRLSPDNYSVHWQWTHCMKCEWKDLFKNKITIKERPGRNDPKRYCSWKWNTTEAERKRYNKRYFDYMFDKTPEPIKQGILTQINQLIPIKYVRREVRGFKKRFNKDTISACVRSWKDVRGTPKERRFDINEVFKNIDANLKTDIFLTSDNDAVYKAFVARYGKDKVLSYPKRTYWGDWGSIEGMQDTLIELYLGGVNKKMFLSWHSAFTECQWWFGGAQAEVTEMVMWR